MILIIGCDGQLGSSFKKFFQEKNIDFLDVDKKELDITNFKDTRASIEYVNKKRKIDLIINCAAYNDVDKAEEEKSQCYLLNMEAVINLANICRDINSTFITFSTDFVFYGQKEQFLYSSNLGFTEEDEPTPQSSYSISKREMEISLMSLIENFKQEIYIIRTSWLFGEISNSNFVEKLITLSESTDDIFMADDMISSPTYTRDLVEITYKLFKSKTDFGIYHITNDGQTSKYFLSKFILDKISWNGNLHKISQQDFHSKVLRPYYSKLNCNKIKNRLNISVNDWQTSLEKYLTNRKS